MYQFWKIETEEDDDPKALIKDSIITGKCQKKPIQMHQPDISV